MVSSKSRWKLSIIDVLFIMIIFFVVVLSHSTLDVSKKTIFKNRKGETSSSSGIISHRGKESEGPPMIKAIYPQRKEEEKKKRKLLKKIKQMKQSMFDKYPEIKNFKVQAVNSGAKLILPERISFPLGSYRPKREVRKLIKEFCPLFTDKKVKRIIIKGHTDNRGGNLNWFLSGKRAESILLLILQLCKVPKEKFEIMACADTEPIASNNTSKGRRENRRVEIILKVTEDK